MDNMDLVLRDVKARENVLLKNVYLWMFLGLAITAIVAFAVANSITVIRLIYTNPLVTVAVFIAQLAIVMVLSGRVEAMRTSTAIGLFLGYSAITGVTFSTIFLAYTGETIFYAFVSAAAVFLAGAVYGTVTKKSLKGWGGYLTMALFGLIIASMLNLFFRSSSFDLVVSLIGVILFTGLSAWDAQRVSDMNARYGSYMTREELTKVGILGALSLYLDFLNIFLYLIRLFGRSDRR